MINSRHAQSIIFGPTVIGSMEAASASRVNPVITSKIKWLLGHYCHFSPPPDSETGAGPSERPHASQKGREKVPCNECLQDYIGQTDTLLDHRIAEHRRTLRSWDVAASALAEHVFTAGHKVDLSEAIVIDAHPHAQTCFLLESWHIQDEQAPSTGEGEHCQDSMPPCWTDIIVHFYIRSFWLFCSVFFSVLDQFHRELVFPSNLSTSLPSHSGLYSNYI